MASDSNGNNKKPFIGFSFAWNGLKEILRTERNFTIHLSAAVIVTMAGIYFNVSRVEWAILFLTFGTVMSTEMINTAIERLLDYLAPDFHPQAGLVKDIAAGAVLVTAIFSVCVGIFIFSPYLLEMFR
ncbi:diacylglycerol kinase family protein [Sediminibacillus massiliensis]|uniref:diacylglycerol kinase family protein n=1 Tax=Sediminibacillus massiliensis TaxID=1926277 RepID=UPI0009885FAD|nr:diacylglycerol kinase family protein [Sediminibacillus massiliensis]